MVAERDLVQYRAGHPARGIAEYPDAARAFVPSAPAELVDLVSGLGTEQRGEFRLIAGQEMHGQSRRIARDVVRVIGDRQSPRKRAGSMLTWVANPTRQPAWSPSRRAVTSNIG